MTNAELLAILEQLNQRVSDSVLAMRELVANESKYTAAAQNALRLNVRGLLARTQRLLDKTPDYRADAPVEGE